jgi:eukaryotic-like serine/threonine-protein kinase
VVGPAIGPGRYVARHVRIILDLLVYVPASVLARGVIIAEKYRVERMIGRGGMGAVVEVTHAQLGTTFALKFMNPGAIENAAITERFFREARAAAALRSEHVCRVFDVGSHQGMPYLVMERLEGQDLAKVLRQREQLPTSDTCDYLLQVCIGLAEAHAAQIVHRDLKPGNLFLTTRPDGTSLVKVLDFGIAKAPSLADNELTSTNMVLGSPSYMSLEQLRSSKLVDARSDIWSLGVILFELVAGQRPFVGESLADLALKISEQPPPRLPRGPAELDEVIAHCLARDPAQRYQHVGQLACALAPFASEAGRATAAGLIRMASASRPPSVPGTVAQPMNNPDAGGSGPVITLRMVDAAESQERTPIRKRLSVGVISILVGAIVVGISVGAVVSGSDDKGQRATGAAGTTESTKLFSPTDAAPAPAIPAPPVREATPAPTTFHTDVGASEPTYSAGSAGSAVASPPVPTSASPAPLSKHSSPRPLAPSQPKKKLPSDADLGKSRI